MIFQIIFLYLLNKGIVLFEVKVLVINFGNLDFIIYFDWIRFLFTRIVLLISSIIYIYRKYYIEGDLNERKFIFLLLFFILSICLVIFSPRIFRVLLGWDGLGFFSYCLVIFYPRVKRCLSGIVTILSNRLGDIILILSIIIIFNTFNWRILLNNSISNYYMILLIFLGGITKRAQFPFSAWLPAAIAAPTPVSALVHSSTLVTAGVYLYIRIARILSISLRILVLIISILTSCIAGIRALYEIDFKKIIALSTLRQLGLIIRILRLGNYLFTLYHLVIHALFKSLLFICAGVIIHSLLGDQDLRKLSRILVGNFYLRFVFFTSNFRLIGIPFIRGFYSKDLIIEKCLREKINLFMYLLLLGSLIITTLYRVRFIYYSIRSSNKIIVLENKLVNFRTFMLLVIRIIGGRLFNWELILEIDFYIMLEEKIFLSFVRIFRVSLILFIHKNIKIYTFRKLWNNFFISLWSLHLLTNYYLRNNFFYISLKKMEKDYLWVEYLETQGLYKFLININKTVSFQNQYFYYFIFFLGFIVLVYPVSLN